MATGNPRYQNGNARRKLRRWLKDQGYSTCAICGMPLDYSLKAGDPGAFEVDEVVPVSKYWLRLYNTQQHCWAGPYASASAAALARENVQATHRSCNQRKSNHVSNDILDTPIFRSRMY